MERPKHRSRNASAVAGTSSHDPLAKRGEKKGSKEVLDGAPEQPPSTHSTRTGFVTEDFSQVESRSMAYLLACCSIASELERNGRVRDAVLVLDGLLDTASKGYTATQLLFTSPQLVEMEVQVRLHAAQLVLQHSSSPDVAKRLWEPAMRRINHPAVPPALRFEVLLLGGVIARRRASHTQALQLFESCLELVSNNEPGTSAPAADTKLNGSGAGSSALPFTKVHRVTAIQEIVRCWYARVVEEQFGDEATVRSLVRVSAPYAELYATEPTAEMAGAVAPIAVCHVMGLLLHEEWDAALKHTRNAAAIFGPTAELSLLEWFIGATVNGAFAPIPALLGETQAQAREGEDQSHVGDGPFSWLSCGCLRAAALLAQLCQASATSRHDDAVGLFNAIVDCTEGRLRALTAPSVVPVPSINAEVRMLVAVKIAAYVEIILLDLTRLRLCEAASKLWPLCTYAMLFRRHTAHFRGHLHVLIAVWALLLRCNVETIESHLQTACEVGDAEARSRAEIVRLTLYYAQRQNAVYATKFAELLEHLKPFYVRLEELDRGSTATMGSSQVTNSLGGSSASQTPVDDQQKPNRVDSQPSLENRLDRSCTLPSRLFYHLLRGAQHLEEHDYASAIETLKRVADAAKSAYGVTSSFLVQSLRLLSAAYSQAGNAEQSDAAITTATQLSFKAQDELCVLQCLMSVLGRMVLLTDADRSRNAQVVANLEAHQQHYDAECRGAETLKDVQSVLSFLPGHEEYDEWAHKIAAQSNAKKRKREPAHNEPSLPATASLDRPPV